MPNSLVNTGFCLREISSCFDTLHSVLKVRLIEEKASDEYEASFSMVAITKNKERFVFSVNIPRTLDRTLLTNNLPYSYFS